jgi:hypothetical protein
MNKVLRIISGIGSRKLKNGDFEQISGFAAKLIKKYDCWIRSGHAPGSDYAWETGAGERCIVYLPFKRFGDRDGLKLKTKSVMCWDKAPEIARRRALTSVYDHHPRYETLDTPGKIRLHARNYFQVFGSQEEIRPVQAVICWADSDGKGGVRGGTGQAVRLANDFGIPVFNMKEMELYKIEQELDKIWDIN